MIILEIIIAYSFFYGLSVFMKYERQTDFQLEKRIKNLFNLLIGKRTEPLFKADDGVSTLEKNRVEHAELEDIVTYLENKQECDLNDLEVLEKEEGISKGEALGDVLDDGGIPIDLGFVPKISRPLKVLDMEELDFSNGFIAEKKYDGFRVMIINDGKRVFARTKNGTEFNIKNFPSRTEADMRDPFILDGELCYSTGKFQEQFQWASLFRKIQKQGIWDMDIQGVFYCFDILRSPFHKQEIYPLSLIDRKEKLAEFFKSFIVKNHHAIKQVAYEQVGFNEAKSLYNQVIKQNWEGLVFKKSHSRYNDYTGWFKYKTLKQAKAIILEAKETNKLISAIKVQTKINGIEYKPLVKTNLKVVETKRPQDLWAREIMINYLRIEDNKLIGVRLAPDHKALK